MLNEIIKIDLHIHSVKSQYKDGDIVKESDVNHLDVLMSKLEENEIQLFAIADHNGFDYNLYESIINKIEANYYTYVKHALPAVEFDVQIEKDKPQCHIVTVFNDNDRKSLIDIDKKIKEVRYLINEDDYYTIEEFESILKKIHLQTILIVHQRQSLNNKKKGTRSLSGAVENPYEIIKCGFIDSLEYSSPKVEGIVKNNLHDANLSFPLITGSDCHEWGAYPYHDNNSIKIDRDFTKLKCLPSFKGLLLSISSFSTRANRIINKNNNYIESILINGKKHKLANGINAIIGDNGSGKSLLVSVLSNNRVNSYTKLIKANKIKRITNGSLQENKICSITQDAIFNRVMNGNLFEDSSSNHFIQIDSTDEFSNGIISYFDKVCSFVKKSININDKRKEFELSKFKFVQYEDLFHYPYITCDVESDDTSFDNERKHQLLSVYKSLKKELNENNDYYTRLGIHDKLCNSLAELKESLILMIQTINTKEINNKVKGIITNILNMKKSSYEDRRSSKEKENGLYKDEKEKFINGIVNYIRIKNQNLIFPDFPKARKGFSINEYKGYEFKKIADYNEVELEEEFYKACFTKTYSTPSKIKSIVSYEEFNDALNRGSSDDLELFKEQRIKAFIKKWQAEKTHISEISTKKPVGNTPGEISLVYYKFMMQEASDEFDVLIIDQPEDDINPLKINDFLLKYLGKNRDLKQIILVTHNPLLVVNLDVDNVIYLNKKGDEIIACSGSLEYECKDYKILDLVKDNLDGGYEVVSRRLKVYERD